MALHPDLAAFRTNVVTSSRTTVFTNAKSTANIRQFSSFQIITTSTSFPTSAGNPTPKVATRWIITIIVAGLPILVICLLLLCCRCKISKRLKKKISKPAMFVPLERRTNMTRSVQPAIDNLDVQLEMLVSLPRPQKPSQNPLVEASGDRAIKLHEVSKDQLEVFKENRDADRDAEYWRSYKERELKRRGSLETEKIRQAIERARAQDHVEWAAYRRSLSESNHRAPIEELFSPGGSMAPTRMQNSLNFADLHQSSTGTLLETEMEGLMGVSHSTAQVNAGTNRGVIDVESLDLPSTYTKGV